MYQSEAQSKAKNNFHFFHLFSLICLLFLAGCQATSSNSSAKIDPSPALHDEIFPGYEAVAIEPEAQASGQYEIMQDTKGKFRNQATRTNIKVNQ